MELELYGYYELTSGGVCRIIDMTDKVIEYVVYGRDGKRLPTLTLKTSYRCLREKFEPVVVRRVKPRIKPKPPKLPPEERWSDMGKIKNYSSYHGD